MTTGEYRAASLLPEVIQLDEESDLDVAATLAALARMKRADRLPDDLAVLPPYEEVPATANTKDVLASALNASL